MLQNLLTERFKMEVHHDTKDVPNYSLVLGKNGSKLKDSTLDASAYAPPTNDGAGRGGPPPPPKPGEFPKLPAGRPGMLIGFATMGCAVGTVRSRLHRGRVLLARQLCHRPAEGPCHLPPVRISRTT